MSPRVKLSFWRALAIVLGVVAAAALVAGRDASDAELTAKLEAEAHARKAMRPEDLLPLSHPLGCDARMQVSVAGRVVQDRCYVRKTPQVWL